MIHSTAIVSANAVIGARCEIGPYVIIEDDVSIGDDTIIESHCVIKRYTQIGSGNHIHSHAVLGDVPQDVSFNKKLRSVVRIGNNNELREYVNIHRSKFENGETIVGNNNYLMQNVHIAHDCVLADRIIAANNLALGGHCTIDSDVFISAGVGIHQFCRIGAFVMIGYGSNINLDAPPYALMSGVPAKVFKLNLVGMRRKGFSSDDFKAIEAVYHSWYHGGMLKADFLKHYNGENTPVVQRFVDFIAGSSRGISGHI